MNHKKHYLAPTFEEVEVVVERGFAQSPKPGGVDSEDTSIEEFPDYESPF